jgi:transcriptional regulator with XRE-family HTH domain
MPNSFDQHVGRQLHAIREGKGLNAGELASLMNVSAKAVDDWECGHVRISAAHLFHISQVLDVPLREFFREVANTSPISDTTFVKPAIGLAGFGDGR